MKEEPLCDLNENSKVKEEEFDDFIENDDYIDDPDFDEDKPIKLPKKRKKPSESDPIHTSELSCSQHDFTKPRFPNSQLVCLDFYPSRSMARANLNKSKKVLNSTTPQHQSTYPRGPESASIEIPPFRPHFKNFQNKFFLD